MLFQKGPNKNLRSFLSPKKVESEAVIILLFK